MGRDVKELKYHNRNSRSSRYNSSVIKRDIHDSRHPMFICKFASEICIISSPSTESTITVFPLRMYEISFISDLYIVRQVFPSLFHRRLVFPSVSLPEIYEKSKNSFITFIVNIDFFCITPHLLKHRNYQF